MRRARLKAGGDAGTDCERLRRNSQRERCWIRLAVGAVWEWGSRGRPLRVSQGSLDMSLDVIAYLELPVCLLSLTSQPVIPTGRTASVLLTVGSIFKHSSGPVQRVVLQFPEVSD